jgi:tetratricopeptide (TPR) repeat protein
MNPASQQELQRLIEQAGESQSRGEYPRAIDLYRQFTIHEPGNLGARINLGVCLSASGLEEDAIREFQHCIRENAGLHQAHYNLGNTLFRLGRFTEARRCFESALALQPNHRSSQKNIAHLLMQIGRYDEAASYFEEALIQRDDVTLSQNLGICYRHMAQWVEAMTCFRRVIKQQPDNTECHVELATCYSSVSRDDDAIACLNKALETDPENAKIYQQLGNLQMKLNQPEEAEQSFRLAYRLGPELEYPLIDLGGSLINQGRFEEAEKLLRKALRRSPDNEHVANNLGRLYSWTQRLVEAEEVYRHGIASHPGAARTHTNLGLLLLLQGRYEEGWREYEWRLKTEDWTKPEGANAIWQGEDLENKRIVLLGEQGAGDAFQTLRYASDMKAQGAHVIVRCRSWIRWLVECCPYVDETTDKTRSLPEHDFYIPMMSIPGIYKDDLTGPLHSTPYLMPPDDKVSEWQQQLSDVSGFRVGLSWQGNTNFKADRFRSIPLAEFSSLFDIEGISLVSLQKGEAGTSQIAGFAHNDQLIDVDSRVQTERDFVDTAGIMKNLDLVITSCTAIAHVAGAMGIPTWVLLDVNADWRWYLDREDSPWYPSVRLFRQDTLGDWQSVFAKVRDELSGLSS